MSNVGEGTGAEMRGPVWEPQDEDSGRDPQGSPPL